MTESLNIVDQCLDRLQPGPVMIQDKKIAWPAAAVDRQRRAGQLS